MEDALFSPKSLAMTLGNGKVGTDLDSILKTVLLTAKEEGGSVVLPQTWTDANGQKRPIPFEETDADGKSAVKLTNEFGQNVTAESLKAGDKVYATFEVPVYGQTIEVSANTYPGTYGCVAA